MCWGLGLPVGQHWRRRRLKFNDENVISMTMKFLKRKSKFKKKDLLITGGCVGGDYCLNGLNVICTLNRSFSYIDWNETRLLWDIAYFSLLIIFLPAYWAAWAAAATSCRMACTLTWLDWAACAAAFAYEKSLKMNYVKRLSSFAKM